MPGKPRCERCGSNEAHRYAVCLVHDEGQQEGQHEADVEIVLCITCSEGVSDDLLRFADDHRGAIQQE